MALLDEILESNRVRASAAADPGSFIANRHLCIVTCVDPRLTRFFADVLGVERGHAVAIRVPGAHIRPGSEALRALADCGVARVTDQELRRVMRARGVKDAAIPQDLAGFFGLVGDVEAAARE